MIKIITQELEIEKGLKQRLEFICEFCHIKPNIVNGRINTIVALKLDRITRSIFDWEKLLTFLEGNDAYLDCANDEINTTTANGKIYTIEGNSSDECKERDYDINSGVILGFGTPIILSTRFLVLSFFSALK